VDVVACLDRDGGSEGVVLVYVVRGWGRGEASGWDAAVRWGVVRGHVEVLSL
jgi:hypothetical protein